MGSKRDCHPHRHPSHLHSQPHQLKETLNELNASRIDIVPDYFTKVTATSTNEHKTFHWRDVT